MPDKKALWSCGESRDEYRDRSRFILVLIISFTFSSNIFQLRLIGSAGLSPVIVNIKGIKQRP
jgi:hypothetical protein